jgi:hypothetical protein
MRRRVVFHTKKKSITLPFVVPRQQYDHVYSHESLLTRRYLTRRQVVKRLLFSLNRFQDLRIAGDTAAAEQWQDTYEMYLHCQEKFAVSFASHTRSVSTHHTHSLARLWLASCLPPAHAVLFACLPVHVCWCLPLVCLWFACGLPLVCL